MYASGEGRMLIKAGSLFTVVDDEGPEMDQGSMMRYLSEMIWFPTAFLDDNISFEPIDDESARVTLTDADKSVSATMYFDEEEKLTDFVAKRYRTVEGGYDLETWSAPVYEYGELAGLKVPLRGGAVWKLPEGDLKYADITITHLEYDIAQVILEANGKSVRAVKPLDEEPSHKVTFQDISEGSPKVPVMQIAPRPSWMMPLLVQVMDPTKVKKSFASEGKQEA